MNELVNKTTTSTEKLKDVINFSPLSTERINKAELYYNVRNIDRYDAIQLLHGQLQPQIGDVVLAKVLAIGQHQRIELGTRRRVDLNIGNEIMAL
ncbi:MAG TPA: hypothetical protein ENJ32_12535 [Crenotrichaceae bacterium]|nr:hypothetical protein [Crenotrichaceae bacterium]